MNLEELKSAWQVYDQKLQSSQAIDEKIIISMIKERSKSRVARLRRENALLSAILFVELLLLGAIFMGNPFDFKYKVQFVPFIFLVIGIIMALAVLLKNYKMLDTDISNTNLNAFLKKIIGEYEKSKQAEKWFGIIILSSGCLTVLSFLPNKLDKKGVWPAMIDTAIPMMICLAIYFLAFKVGAFKNRKADGFKDDLRELEELSLELIKN
ncbi:hypothetical protein [Emticicia sp. SJ17W-69]|uniref:hypothetical protein n=1 Tax=Emticicia sp. SJ17W-69 TaxID=3421657 RepID=UPI003EB8FB9F